MGNILTYLGLAKYAVPVVEAAITEIKTLAPVEKADVQAALTAIEKAVGDLKGGFEALEAAVKAAISQA